MDSEIMDFIENLYESLKEFFPFIIILWLSFICINIAFRSLKRLTGYSYFSNPFEDMFDSISDLIYELKSKKTKPQKELIQINVSENSYDTMKDFVAQHRLCENTVEVIKDKPYKINLSKDKPYKINLSKDKSC